MDWQPRYSVEEVEEALADSAWEDLPSEWVNLQPSDAIILRSHDYLNPDSSQHFSVIHAAPRLILAPASHSLVRRCANFPLRAILVTAYRAVLGQKFYPDETLEFVAAGTRQDNGVPIEAITEFNTLDHFETGITPDNEKLGTWIVAMPYPEGSSLSTAVDRQHCRRTLVTPGSRLESVLMQNAKPKGVHSYIARPDSIKAALVSSIHAGRIRPNAYKF